jgi:hypothetical protein
MGSYHLMVNSMINTNNEPAKTVTTQVEQQKPNESTGIYVRGFVRITDPETGQVLVETDN